MMFIYYIFIFNLYTLKLFENFYRQSKKQLLELFKMTYNVSRVFITFETQKQKDNCLQKLKVSTLDLMFNTYHNDHRKFDNLVVLNVQQPGEPNVILWRNLKVI